VLLRKNDNFLVDEQLKTAYAFEGNGKSDEIREGATFKGNSKSDEIREGTPFGGNGKSDDIREGVLSAKSRKTQSASDDVAEHGNTDPPTERAILSPAVTGNHDREAALAARRVLSPVLQSYNETRGVLSPVLQTPTNWRLSGRNGVATNPTKARPSTAPVASCDVNNHLVTTPNATRQDKIAALKQQRLAATEAASSVIADQVSSGGSKVVASTSVSKARQDKVAALKQHRLPATEVEVAGKTDQANSGGSGGSTPVTISDLNRQSSARLDRLTTLKQQRKARQNQLRSAGSQLDFAKVL
jgi:hypothetical protein